MAQQKKSHNIFVEEQQGKRRLGILGEGLVIHGL
jgi:hypothetical protein